MRGDAEKLFGHEARQSQGCGNADGHAKEPAVESESATPGRTKKSKKRGAGSRRIKMSHRKKATKAMGSILALMILSIPAIAQVTPAVVERACGPEKTHFEVKRVKSLHPTGEPEPGKARVYFVQDLGVTNCVDCVTIRMGVDGRWVGANQRNSYFSASVDAGEHHLCAIPQPSYLQSLVGLVHFTAEAGKTYYFRVRMFSQERQGLLDFEPIDSDQAEYLIATYPLSVSYPKNEK